MSTSFNMSSYIEQKRKEGNKIMKGIIPSTRKNNVGDKDVMEEFFNQEMETKSKKEPSPQKIIPLLRYRKNQQDKILKKIFAESKKHVMVCNPKKTAIELEDKINEEMDKRFNAWQQSHYKN